MAIKRQSEMLLEQGYRKALPEEVAAVRRRAELSENCKGCDKSLSQLEEERADVETLLARVPDSPPFADRAALVLYAANLNELVSRRESFDARGKEIEANRDRMKALLEHHPALVSAAKLEAKETAEGWYVK
jgi:hypothetical protein